MRRIHAFELEDQEWFPRTLREAGMAFLRFAAERGGQAERIRPVIEAALDASGESEILDLCSGGGGPALAIARALHAAGRPVRLTMTDRFPCPPEQVLHGAAGGDTEPCDLRYDPTPVDATAVPASRPGLRTLFNCFHHFAPAQARRLLTGAVESGHAIAIVEVLQRSLLVLPGILLAPLITLAVVPFLRPLRPAWLLLTYVIPVIPLFVFWDGLVSSLRIYDRAELLEMAHGADPRGRFEWTVQEVPMFPQPVPGIALVGIPKR